MTIRERLEENRDYLIREYEGGRSCNNIAKEMNCSVGAIHNFLSNLIELRPHNKKYDEVEQQIIKEYQAGLTTGEISKKLGVHRSSVIRKLRKNGISLQDRYPVHIERLKKHEEELIQLYQKGLSYQKIGDQFNCSGKTIQYFLHSKVESRLPKNQGKLNEIKEEIIKMCEAGFNYEEISEKYEFNHSSVRSALLKWGYKSKCDVYGEKIQKKRRETWQKKYGVDNPLQAQSIKEKIKNTNLKKYGVENPSYSDKIKEKIKKRQIEVGWTKIYQNRTMKDWAKEKKMAYTTFTQNVQKFGFEKAIKMNPKRTDLEEKMKNWLDEKNINYIQEYRVDNKIADFYIPSHNLILELNGLWWHSDSIIKDYKYHQNKQKIYQNNNLTPLFFNGDEIHYKFPIIQSIILNKLNQTEKIYARKCQIIKVKSPNFFYDNHLMGAGRGHIYGLEYENELICALQFKCIRKKEKIYEISRFCPQINLTILGGFSKLLSNCQKKFSPTQIITFIDQRYGQGNYLEKLGFKFKCCHLSFRWTDYKQTFHRTKCPSNTGYKKRLAKIWDCGQAKWIKTIKKPA